MSDFIPIGTDEQSKAVVSVAEAATEGIKTAAKAGGWVASIVQDVPKDLIGVMGGDWLHHTRLRTLASLEDATGTYLEKVAAERRTEPSPSVLVPLLTYAVDESRAELRDLWARLLANAMIDGGRKVRRDFLETVKRMEPIDAVVLEACVEGSPASSPQFSQDHVMAKVQTRIKRQLPQHDLEVSIGALDSLRCIRSGNMIVLPYGRSLISALVVD